MNISDIIAKILYYKKVASTITELVIYHGYSKTITEETTVTYSFFSNKYF